MSCPICFFRDNNQRSLKENCFGLPRFEQKLRRYKDIFVDGVNDMKAISNCSCYSIYNNANLVTWANDFLIDLKAKTAIIQSTFDDATGFYIDYITRNQKIALDNLWSYVRSNNLASDMESPIRFAHLLFRGRKRTGFDERNAREFFHIPFTLRHFVGNQRFSISGQPMLYLGSLVLTVVKELDSPIDKLALAGFLPDYSSHYNKKIFSLTNYLNDVIENSLPGIFGAGSSISYYDKSFSPNDGTIERDIRKTILMHICTFPREYPGSFAPEYVLPQMLTTALMENGFDGLIFPSTKNFAELTDYHRFSSHHLNLGYFVSYHDVKDIDEGLLQSFSVYTLDGSESFNLTSSSVLAEIDALTKKPRNPAKNYNDYILPLVKLRLHLEYLGDSTLSGVKYFDTRIGKVELEFHMKMIRHLETLMK